MHSASWVISRQREKAEREERSTRASWIISRQREKEEKAEREERSTRASWVISRKREKEKMEEREEISTRAAWVISRQSSKEEKEEREERPKHSASWVISTECDSRWARCRQGFVKLLRQLGGCRMWGVRPGAHSSCSACLCTCLCGLRHWQRLSGV